MFATEVKCAPLNTTTDAALNTTGATYGTIVGASCQLGYAFSDGENVIVTQCKADKSWSVKPSYCSRKFHVNFSCINDGERPPLVASFI